MRYHRTPLDVALRGASNLDDLLTRQDFEDAYTADPDFHVVFSEDKARGVEHLDVEMFDATLTSYAQALVASWRDRVADGEAEELNPVERATVAALDDGCSLEETVAHILAAARDAEDRASARAALLGVGRTDLLPVIRSFVGEDDIGKTPTMYEPTGMGEVQAPLTQEEHDERAKSSTLGITVYRLHAATYPLMAWDPAQVPTVDAIPVDVRAVFPAADLPSVIRYREGEGPYFFDRHELDVLVMMHSDGHTELVFDGLDASETFPLADVGAQVAITRWQRTLEFNPDDHATIEAAQATLGMFLDAGGQIDFELMLDCVDDRAESVAVVAEAALMAAERAASPAEARGVLRAVERAAGAALRHPNPDDVLEAIGLLQVQAFQGQRELGRSTANDAWEM